MAWGKNCENGMVLGETVERQKEGKQRKIAKTPAKSALFRAGVLKRRLPGLRRLPHALEAAERTGQATEARRVLGLQ